MPFVAATDITLIQVVRMCAVTAQAWGGWNDFGYDEREFADYGKLTDFRS